MKYFQVAAITTKEKQSLIERLLYFFGAEIYYFQSLESEELKFTANDLRAHGYKIIFLK